ncbi:MAG TPA: class I SAM-dependent methyltransferase [Fibrobacteria bacterium]|nr:class I SAM-dependent methyltransferase [Fibrobacteria bacterium]
MSNSNPLQSLRRKLAVGVRSLAAGGIPSHFITGVPSPQNAVDIFKGEWASKLPGENLASGQSHLFQDDRLQKVLGDEGVEGMDILELGPLEGGHSYQLEKLGAKSVCAVEANSRAYLKCLVVKELYALQKVRFLLGDIYEHLQQDTSTYDLILNFGVLYHLRDPQRLFQLAAPRLRAGGRLLLWTHFWAPSAEECPALKGHFTAVRTVSLPGGQTTELRRHEYGSSFFKNNFFGGNANYSEWMTRDGILQAAQANGLSLVFDETIEHHHGPSILATFRKT